MKTWKVTLGSPRQRRHWGRGVWLSFPWKQSRQKDKMATFVTLMASRRKVVEQLFEKKRLDGIFNNANMLLNYRFLCLFILNIQRQQSYWNFDFVILLINMNNTVNIQQFACCFSSSA